MILQVGTCLDLDDHPTCLVSLPGTTLTQIKRKKTEEKIIQDKAPPGSPPKTKHQQKQQTVEHGKINSETNLPR